jgi:mono/diheme cytochrome c family protein
MRHVLANLATYFIAIFLLIGAGIFAWLRSEQVTFTSEAAVLAQYEPGDPGFRWAELGHSSYRRNCMNCHGSEGAGWDQYPGLDRSAALFSAPAGREYMIDLHLYGLASRRWRAPMPPMGHLQDVEVAAVINYVVMQFGDPATLGDSRLLLPSDVTRRRGQRSTPAAVDRRRPMLEEQTVRPR